MDVHSESLATVLAINKADILNIMIIMTITINIVTISITQWLYIVVNVQQRQKLNHFGSVFSHKIKPGYTGSPQFTLKATLPLEIKMHSDLNIHLYRLHSCTLYIH